MKREKIKDNFLWSANVFYYMYIQTWAKEHLRIATNCPKWHPFWGNNSKFLLNNDLWTCQQRPLLLGPEGCRYSQVWLHVSCYLQTLNLRFRMFTVNSLISVIIFTVIAFLFLHNIITSNRICLLVVLPSHNVT